MRRGREVQQLDIGYPDSSLAQGKAVAVSGVVAGDRAPDAPVRGAAGQSSRLFELFRGGHWTLLGYQVERGSVQPRPGLHIHAFGPQGDLFDVAGHFFDAYNPAVGDWLLVRPDGYMGAIFAAGEVAMLEAYLEQVGLGGAAAGQGDLLQG